MRAPRQRVGGRGASRGAAARPRSGALHLCLALSVATGPVAAGLPARAGDADTSAARYSAMVRIERREKSCEDGEACWKVEGSGFFSTRDGAIVTAAHVVAPKGRAAEDFELRALPANPLLKPGPVTVLERDGTLDLACLHFTVSPAVSLATLSIADTPGMASQDEVVVTGWPLGKNLREAKGRLLSLRLDQDHAGKWLAAVSGVTNGDSGGPVVDPRNGLAVAVVSQAQPIADQLYLAPLASGQLGCVRQGFARAAPAEAAGPARVSFSEAELAILLRAAASGSGEQRKAQLAERDALPQKSDLTSEQLTAFFIKIGDDPPPPDELGERLTALAERLKRAERDLNKVEFAVSGSDAAGKAKVERAKASLARGDTAAAETLIHEILWTWPEGASRTIPVCWEPASPAAARDKAFVREVVASSWEASANIAFTGWGVCSPSARGLRIAVKDVGPQTRGFGRTLDGLPNGVTLNFAFNAWSRECAKDEATRRICIQANTLHEFGHALGFTHEHSRPDAPLDCRSLSAASEPVSWRMTYGPYDPDSVMNFCNRNLYVDPKLSPADKVAAAAVYGARTIRVVE